MLARDQKYGKNIRENVDENTMLNQEMQFAKFQSYFPNLSCKSPTGETFD